MPVALDAAAEARFSFTRTPDFVGERGADSVSVVGEVGECGGCGGCDHDEKKEETVWWEGMC